MPGSKDRIRALRKANNMSQTRLARELDVSPSTITKWENGKRFPRGYTLERLCELFGVSDDYFYTGDGIDLPEETQRKVEYESNLKKSKDVINRYLELSSKSQRIVDSMVRQLYSWDKEEGLLENRRLEMRLRAKGEPEEK